MVNLAGQIKTRSGSIASFCPQLCNTFIVPCTELFCRLQDQFMRKKTYWLPGVLLSKGSDLFCLIQIQSVQLHEQC